MIGLYGPIFFHSGSRGLSTFNEMKKTVTARWGDHPVHLSKPLLEYGGPQLIEITFRMELIKPFTVDPLATIIMLEEVMDLAIPLPLVIGMKPMGRGMSFFVLTSLSHEMKYFYRGGGLMGASVEVQLKEYPTTLSISSLTQALGGVFGGITGAISGVTGAVSSAISGITGAVTGVVSGVTGAVNNIGGAISTIGTNASAGLLPTAMTNIEQTAFNTAVNNVVPQLVQNFGNPVPSNLGFGINIPVPLSPPSLPVAIASRT